MNDAIKLSGDYARDRWGFLGMDAWIIEAIKDRMFSLRSARGVIAVSKSRQELEHWARAERFNLIRKEDRAMSKKKGEKKAKAEKAAKVEQPVVKTAGPKTRKKAVRTDGTMSGLDAAAKVLADAGEPLNCKTIVERVLEKGLWKTGGKTPAATVYSAILREITKKGGESRFQKADRGMFRLKA